MAIVDDGHRTLHDRRDVRACFAIFSGTSNDEAVPRTSIEVYRLRRQRGSGRSQVLIFIGRVGRSQSLVIFGNSNGI